jgi:hypothetical protein
MPRPSGLISHRSQHQCIASSCHLRECYFLDNGPFTAIYNRPADDGEHCSFFGGPPARTFAGCPRG